MIETSYVLREELLPLCDDKEAKLLTKLLRAKDRWTESELRLMGEDRYLTIKHVFDKHLINLDLIRLREILAAEKQNSKNIEKPRLTKYRGDILILRELGATFYEIMRYLRKFHKANFSVHYITTKVREWQKSAKEK